MGFCFHKLLEFCIFSRAKEVCGKKCQFPCLKTAAAGRLAPGALVEVPDKAGVREGLGGDDEAPADKAAEAVGTAAVEAASGFNVWIILAVVLVIAGIAGFIMYKNGIRKGGQDNE